MLFLMNFAYLLSAVTQPLSTSYIIILSSSMQLHYTLFLNFFCSSSIVCGIIFWTGIGILICITKLTTLLIQWTPTKFDPEIEAVSFLKCIPYPLNCNPTGPVLNRDDSRRKSEKSCFWGFSWIKPHFLVAYCYI